MNDPLEAQLRALKPAALPSVLTVRLNDPPPVRGVARTIFRSILWASAAACIAFVFIRHTPPSPVSRSIPVMAASSSSRVTEARPLSVITDEANRTWKMMEVQWVDESTFVTAKKPVAVQRQDHYRTVVPVAVQFD
jgi:hypothetical protein